MIWLLILPIAAVWLLCGVIGVRLAIWLAEWQIGAPCPLEVRQAYHLHIVNGPIIIFAAIAAALVWPFVDFQHKRQAHD